MNREPLLHNTPVCLDHNIRVQFGDICCALTCHDAEMFGRLKKVYSIFQSAGPPDINIKLEVVDKLDRAQVVAILSQMRLSQQEHNLPTMNPAYNIEFDAAKSTFAVTADRCLFDASLKFKMMNRLFRLAYFTVSRLKHQRRPPAMLVHTSGILRNGQVLLFTGPCETGKTTIGRLCGDDYGQLLNDEMLLLSWPHPGNGTLRVHSIPILGELPFRLNTSAPLDCIFLLKQGQRTAVRRVDRKEAYLRFIYQVISPAHFRETDRKAVFSLIAEFADEVTKAKPFYELEFALDKNLLWEVEARLTEIKIME